MSDAAVVLFRGEKSLLKAGSQYLLIKILSNLINLHPLEFDSFSLIQLFVKKDTKPI